MSLELQQAAFAAALVDARAVEELDGIFADSHIALPRLALYRGNIAAAQATALSRAYPVVRALVGDEYFAGLCSTYGRAYPSTSGDLNAFGGQLAAFVGGLESAATVPYLANVAALEWLVHRAYYVADSRALSREHILSLSPEAMLARSFALQTGCSWLSSNFAVATIWQAHQTDHVVALPDHPVRPEVALVIRTGWRVDVLTSSLAETTALGQFGDCGTMQAAIAAGRAVDPSFDFAAALVRWLDAGILLE